MKQSLSRCKGCGIRFQCAADDLEFYRLAGVPAPSRCPDCRVQRRMSWRNDRTFSVRKSDFSGKQMVSIYPPVTPFPVYHPAEWYGDGWDPFSFGRDVDLNRPFFEQWSELFAVVPRLGIDIVNCENSDYCNYCGDDKNCYLDIAGEANEDCYYNLFTKYSKNCVDCTFAYHSELCYELIVGYRCYNVRFSMYMESASDCQFCFDLKGCRDCLFCWNLRQKQYRIFNEQYSEEEYRRRAAEFRLSTRSGIAEAQRRWESEVLAQAIHRDMYRLSSEDCVGNDIKSSKACAHVYNVSNCEGSKYLYDVLDALHCYDLNYSLYHPERSLEIISTLGMKYSAFSMASHYCSEVFYCDLCNNSSHLFGCIGLKRQQYCILNKQYSADEYRALKSAIIERMSSDGEWGEFFPSALSPFGYNETVAQEYFPLRQEAAANGGFQWRERPERGFYSGPPVVLPDEISSTSDSVIGQVLCCESSGRPYKVILPELRYYRAMGLPLPGGCPDERHRARLARRTARHLWDSHCDSCSAAIVTTYPPECSYRVYCEGCYHRELHE